MSTQPLELTADEIRILTDAIGNADKEDGREVAKPLLLLLGTAFLEMLPPDAPKPGTVTVCVNEAQAWLLRSKLNSGLRTDRQPKLGIECLRKLYAILIAFDTAEATGPVADAEGGDMTMAEAQKRLTQRVADTSCGGA